MSEFARSCIIALCGKGGVGKTALSAAIIKILTANPQKRVLAIDADPAVGLSLALGLEVVQTVDGIRNELIRQAKSGEHVDKREVLARLEYEMLAALEERQNLAFLAIGRPENEGCYCQVNHMLKDIIASMALSFDYVVIDGEAGIEQVNRRVMEGVTHLLLVSDASRKAIKVAETILGVADRAIGYDKAGLVVNRLQGGHEFAGLRIPPALARLGWVPEDRSIREADMAGKNLLEAAGGDAAAAVRRCLLSAGIVCE